MEERNRLGMNQTDFAAHGDVGKATQINYEKGERSPDADYLAAVASVGVDVLYVVTGKRSGSASLSQVESELLTKLRQGSPVLRGYLQELGQSTASGGNTVTIGGDVGQSVAGNASFAAPVSFGKKNK
ncbi:helix-turn-helix transcriptional regulator [Acidovorax sp.]|uniref:helix-turn-helix domain-containing protein n=1 Tax=Acidovorax sp. TaxID=1872122 RepID=UPI0031D03E97